jgi:hypothetical protein
MFFVDENNPSKSIVTPSLTNWIFTLQSFLYIWKKFEKKNTTNISLPHILIKVQLIFFSWITRPTFSYFVSSVKALLINNLVSLHSVRSNCEEDESCGVLDPFKDLLKEEYIIQRILPQFSLLTEAVTSDSQDLSTPYVAGFAAKKKLTCTACKNIM